MEDQNWLSWRAQDFLHDVDASQSHEVPTDDLWGFLSDDDNDSSSESNEHSAEGCKMPGLSISESESNNFVLYTLKTVSSILLVSERTAGPYIM